MFKLKDRIYDYLVKNNDQVCYEYERYVREHLIEHYENRWKQWKILWQLNVHYRIKKRKEPFLYWDKRIEKRKDKTACHAKSDCQNSTSVPSENPGASASNSKKIPESEHLKRISPVQLAKQLLKFDIVSFDVFDTLIFRPFREPFDLFDIVGAELNIANFKALRRKAESVAREETAKRNRQTNIYEIYRVLSRYVSIDVEYAVRTEFEIEKRLCFANPYMKQVFSIMRLNNKDVIALSDMYLPEEMLCEILAECGYSGFLKVIVSCDLQTGKASGGLQQQAQKLLGCGKKYVHVGDDFPVDIKASRKMGWNAIHYPNVNSIRNQVYPPISNNIDASVYHGIIAAYVHNGLMNKNKYYQHGFIYGGIMAEGYCEFLEELAKEKSVDKFLFVSRDANILWKIYTGFFNKIDSEYIMWSRLAAYTTTFDKFADDIVAHSIQEKLNDGSVISIAEALNEAGLYCVKDLLKKSGFDLKTALTKINASLIMDIILRNRDVVVKEYAKHKQAAKSYFSSIIKGSKKICIVDIGWRGTTLIQLKSFLHDFFPNLEVILSFAGLKTVGSSFCTTDYLQENIYVYMFSGEKNRDLFTKHFNPKMPLNNCMSEIIFGAPQPSFIGFREMKPNEYGLVFSDAEIPNFTISRDIQNGIKDFIRTFHNLLGEYKKYIRVSPYTAYLPLYHAISDMDYIKELFKNYEMNMIAGIYSNDRKTAIGEYIERYKL